jgi:UPF0271 protein
MIKEKIVISDQGNPVPIEAETICIHGDGAHAIHFAREIREALEANGITIKACEIA